MLGLKNGAVAVDALVFEWMQHHRCHALDVGLRDLSALTGPWTILLWAFLAALAALSIKRYLVAFQLLVGTALGNVLIEPLKSLAGRARPVPAVAIVTHGFSFPSGHAVASTIFLTLLYFLFARRSRYTLAYLVMAIIADVAVDLSRVYLGAHWLSDVLAGDLFGGAWAWWFIAWTQRLFKRWNEQDRLHG